MTVLRNGRAKQKTGSLNTNQTAFNLGGLGGGVGRRHSKYKKRAGSNVKVCGPVHYQGQIWSVNTKQNSICVPPSKTCSRAGGVGRINAPRFSCSKSDGQQGRDIDIRPPVFTSPNTFTVEENETFIGNVTATDPEGNPVTFTISGDVMEITPDGVLTFKTPPDFGFKTNFKTSVVVNNETTKVFTATVTASDGANTSTQEITVNVTPTPSSFLVGDWKIEAQNGTMGVGENAGDLDWWSNDNAINTERECFFDDIYHFGADGSFKNKFGSDNKTWIEGWQYGAKNIYEGKCGAPVAPHNGPSGATWQYDSTSQTITLNGKGSYLGVPKVNNSGELTDPSAAPESIKYNISASTATTMTIQIDFGPGWWQFKFTKVVPISSSFIVSVAANNSGSGNVYVIEGVQKKQLTLKIGTTYTFVHPTSHPFRFSIVSDGTHGVDGGDYTTGVTTSSGSTVIEVTADTQTPLYYYCSFHSGMGGSISIV